MRGLFRGAAWKNGAVHLEEEFVEFGTGSRLRPSEQKTVRRRPVASKEPPLHVPYRLLVLQARADVAPPQKRRRRRRVVRKKALPRVASLGNPKHARHAPLHPHDVDAFLAGAAPRRPLAPNVNVYRVAVPF